MGAKASSSRTPQTVLPNFGELVCLKHYSPAEYRWTLRDVSYHCKDINCVTSPQFSSSEDYGSLWRICLYPYGCTADCENFVSIFVKSESHAQISCTNQKPETQSKEGDFGYNKFMSRNDLLTKLDDYNDELVIICKIKRDDRIMRKYNLSLELSHNYKTSILELLGDFGELLNNSELSDVDLLASDGKVFKLHKAVLAARSKVFHAMFQNKMLEHHTSIVKIKDFDGSVMEQVLKFVYTTKSEITDDNAKDVLLAADKYDIGALKRECIEYLRSSINIQNAVDLLEFAEKYEVKDLKLKAQLFIAENAKDITQQPDFDLASLNAEAVNQLFRQMATISK